MTQQEKSVALLLKRVGIPPHIKGYEFIKRAVLMVLEDGSRIHYITKDLYPSVAKEYKTTASRTERVIRHAVETAFDNMPPEMIEELFGNCVSFNKGKPTNSQFIATLVEAIKMNEEDESEENTNEKKNDDYVIKFVDSRSGRAGVQ